MSVEFWKSEISMFFMHMALKMSLNKNCKKKCVLVRFSVIISLTIFSRWVVLNLYSSRHIKTFNGAIASLRRSSTNPNTTPLHCSPRIKKLHAEDGHLRNRSATLRPEQLSSFSTAKNTVIPARVSGSATMLSVVSYCAAVAIEISPDH